jgi:hypothetical protein
LIALVRLISPTPSILTMKLSAIEPELVNSLIILAVISIITDLSSADTT